MPSALNDPRYEFRPLAVARGFFAYFVKNRIKEKLDTGQRWSDHDSSDIMGPDFRIEKGEQISHISSFKDSGSMASAFASRSITGNTL